MAGYKWVLAGVLAVCTVWSTAVGSVSALPDSNLEKLAYALGVQAYIYGYPLVEVEKTKEEMLRTRAPINQFYYSETLATPEYKDIVTPNSNTLYFSGWLDLAKGPVILHVPENTTGRYYTVQMLDAYTNTFHNVSSTSTKGKVGQYVIVGPSNKGSHSSEKIQAPTNTVWLIGRVEVTDKEDLPQALAFEKQFSLTSNTQGSKQQKAPITTPDSKKKQTGHHPIAFFDVMTEMIKQNPPPYCDHVLLDQFKIIGIDVTNGVTKQVLHPSILAGLNRAVADAPEMIKGMEKYVPKKNGWVIAYNIGTYGDQFLLRAYVAYSGIGANVPQEELYARTFVDQQGRQLNGANPYVIHFNKDQLPAVNAFWSITMYGPDFFLISNPINRYTIGDLNKLQYNQDGSLDIYLQQKPPKGKESNWLPAPTGDFNLVMRMFEPKPSLLHGNYVIPPVQRKASL